MNFFINKNATLPILKLQLIQNGTHDFRGFYEKLQNSNIFFTMTDKLTGIQKTCRAVVGCQIFTETCDEKEEYYITYQFSRRETSKPGEYIGQFHIEFLDGSGTLIVPIRETLKIFILDNGIKK